MSIMNSDYTYQNLHPLNWIEIIDKAFHLYRKHFRLFIGIAIIYFIVDLLRESSFLFLWKINTSGLVAELINHLLSILAFGVFIVAASEIYFNRHITIKDTFQRFINIYPRYLANTVIYLTPFALLSLIQTIMNASELPLSTIMTALLLLLSLPVYVYFSIAWILYAPIIIGERSVSTEPLRRSRDLIRNVWWRVCGTIIALQTLLVAIHFIYIVLFVILFGVLGLMEEGSVVETAQFVFNSIVEPHSVKSVSLSFLIVRFLVVATDVFTTPLYAITILLIYFNRRIQREALDIEMTAATAHKA